MVSSSVVWPPLLYHRNDHFTVYSHLIKADVRNKSAKVFLRSICGRLIDISLTQSPAHAACAPADDDSNVIAPHQSSNARLAQLCAFVSTVGASPAKKAEPHWAESTTYAKRDDDDDRTCTLCTL